MKRPDWLSQPLLVQAAQRLGCGYAETEAVARVECPRDPFDERGNITNLYERHIYYEQAQKRGLDPEAIAQQYPFVRHLISAAAFPKGGYGKYAEQITRFALLAQLPFEGARDLAIESCSWGAWQVMGKWWNELSYPSAEEFLLSMRTVDGQLEAFCRYIEVFNLADALRNRDWDKFAFGYNGKNYKKFGYDWKLSEAYIAIVRRDSPKKPLAQSSTVRTSLAVGSAGLGAGAGMYNAQNPTPPSTEVTVSTPVTTTTQVMVTPPAAPHHTLLTIAAGQSLTIVILVSFVIYHYIRKRGGHVQ